MTREQRGQSALGSELRAALDRFEAHPYRLPPHLVKAVLNELCEELGICLPPQGYEVVEADPPTDPRAFTELVVRLEGVEGDAEIFSSVLGRVFKTFEGAARP